MEGAKKPVEIVKERLVLILAGLFCSVSLLSADHGTFEDDKKVSDQIESAITSNDKPPASETDKKEDPEAALSRMLIETLRENKADLKLLEADSEQKEFLALLVKYMTTEDQDQRFAILSNMNAMADKLAERKALPNLKGLKDKIEDPKTSKFQPKFSATESLQRNIYRGASDAEFLIESVAITKEYGFPNGSENSQRVSYELVAGSLNDHWDKPAAPLHGTELPPNTHIIISDPKLGDNGALEAARKFYEAHPSKPTVKIVSSASEAGMVLAELPPGSNVRLLGHGQGNFEKDGTRTEPGFRLGKDLVTGSNDDPNFSKLFGGVTPRRISNLNIDACKVGECGPSTSGLISRASKAIHAPVSAYDQPIGDNDSSNPSIANEGWTGRYTVAPADISIQIPTYPITSTPSTRRAMDLLANAIYVPPSPNQVPGPPRVQP